MFQCDVCIGKPDADDWCDECNTCIHQCQCDLNEEAAAEGKGKQE